MNQYTERTPEERRDTPCSSDLMTGKWTIHWDNQRNPDLSAKAKKQFVVLGVVALILGVIVFRNSAPSPGPLDTVVLILQGRSTSAKLIHSEEVEVEDDRGNVSYSDVGTYRYQVRGVAFKMMDKRPSGELPETTQVEYLPDNPKVCRIKGEGAQSIWEFVIHDVLLGALFFAVCISPAVWLLREGLNVHDWRKWWKDRFGK